MICEKIKYDSYKEAIAAVISVTKKGKHKMSAYKCDHCFGFHLTTINKKTLYPSSKDSKYPLKKEDYKPNKKEKFSNKNKFNKQEPTKIINPSTEKLISKELAEKLKSKLNGTS